jgi:uncharacterized delta-60 repeat protein
LHQPREQIVSLYQSATIGVTAGIEVPTTYQWRKNGVAINGATNDQFNIRHSLFQDEGFYSVVVSTSQGSIVSTNAKVSVVLPKGGETDFSFGIGSPLDGPVWALAPQSNGRIIIGGAFSGLSGVSRKGIACLTKNGENDNTFFGAINQLGGTVYAVAIQGDGKIVVGGIERIGEFSRAKIARLNADGSADSAFVPLIGGINDYVFSLAIQNDQKILVAGGFTNLNGFTRRGVARLNADGTLDTTFQNPLTNYVFNIPTVYSVAAQSDGNILLGGSFYVVDGLGRTNWNILRLDASGGINTTFVLPLYSTNLLGANGIVRCIEVQTDGKTVVGGDFSGIGLNGGARLARLNANATLDNTFHSPSFSSATTPSVRSVAIQADGKLVLGGWFTAVDQQIRNKIARLNPDGSLDNGFQYQMSGLDSADAVASVRLQSDGRILIGGAFHFVNGVNRNWVARLTTDGSLDATFVSEPYTTAQVLSIAIQSDGKVLTGGPGTAQFALDSPCLSRFNADGTRDLGFAGTLLVSNGVSCLAVQPDDKILIGGSFNISGGPTRIARLNNAGGLDTNFMNGLAGADGIVRAIAFQNDGKILIAGDFSRVNGQSRGGVARLNADGTLDSLLAGMSGISGSTLGAPQVRCVATQTDGKLLIGGDFRRVNEVARAGFARLNPDGSLDTSFQNAGGQVDGRVNAVAMQADGRIVIGGEFTTVNGASRSGLARLNVDGSVDTSFPNGFSGPYGATSLAVQPDGKLVVGGGRL